MNNQVLSKKMNIILEKMGCTKAEFLKLCQTFEPTISKSTILNLINGTGKRIPSVETLRIVVKVCHTYGKGKLKSLTFDYLLNDENNIDIKYLEIYHEFGLTQKTLEFLNVENTIGLLERNTLKGINDFLPNIRRCFFNQVFVANMLVEILKRIKMLDDENSDKNQLIAEIAGYLNTPYILTYLKQNKCINEFIKKLEKENTTEEIICILNELRAALDDMYSASKYFLIDSINEYYQEREENLYKYF